MPSGDLAEPSRTWSIYSGPGPWTTLINSAAIDSHENLYVSDGYVVYVVQSGAASVYLDAATIGATPGDPIQSLDVGPDDSLYFLAGKTIYHSSGAGQVTTQPTARLCPHQL